MSIREQFPGDRGCGATQDVASVLAAITLPSIEPFGTDNAALAGLPAYTPAPVPTPEPPSRNSVAFGVHQHGIDALVQLRRLEGSIEASKVRLVAQVCGAAEVQMNVAGLDSWQRSVSGASTATEVALALQIPERTAASLEYHATEIVSSYPLVLAGLDAGDFSYRHAVTMIDECDTLRSTAGITPQDMPVFLEKLLRLVVNTTVASFAGKARRARERMHPETITTRTKEAFSKRKISCDSGTDGMSWLTLYLPTVSATAIYTHCTRLSRAIKRDAAAAHHTAQSDGTEAQYGEDLREHRTLDQLRADIATLLLLGQALPTVNTGVSRTTSANTASSTADTDPATTAGTGKKQGSAASETSWWAGRATAAGAESTTGVDLFDDDEEPLWAHSTPENHCLADDTEPARSPVVAPGNATINPSDTFGSYFAGDHPNSGTIAHPEAATMGSDEAMMGQLPGDGSGFVDGLVDGIIEHPLEDYLEQLETLSRSKIMIDPPLPQALLLVTTPLLGLLGITDEPAELAGPDGGPMSQDVARRLLGNSTSFLRVLTDPISGDALPLRPESYRLSAAEKAALQAFVGGCYVPNCRNPVVDTELDHVRAFEFGGQSTMDNLKPACKRHHHMRHLKDDKDRHGKRRSINEPERNSIRVRGWTPKATSDGRIGWITPTGNYQRPLRTDPPRPKYPKWLKKLITRTTKKQNG